MMSIVLNTLSWDLRWCQQFFGSHTYMVLFSFLSHWAPKTSHVTPCSNVFATVFFFFFFLCKWGNLPSYQHICLWRWAETLFCKHASQISSRGTCKVYLALGGNSFWCDRNSLFSSRLLSLCTVEEPRVPTLEVTLITSCWQLHVSLSSAVEVRTPPPPQAFGLLLLLLIWCSTRR